MPRHERFQWDPAKDSANRRKHGVSFSDAAEVLMDPFADSFHVTWLDCRDPYQLEERWITLGSHPYNRSYVMYLVWNVREDKHGEVTRIISARPATPRERKLYEEKTYPA